MRVVVGVDPGRSGAVVVIDMRGKPVEFVLTEKDFTVKLGKGTKRGYLPNEMAFYLERLDREYDIALVVLERQQAMPKQGVTSSFKTGHGYGLWQGICAALRLPYIEPRPATWTRTILRDVPGEGKERAVYAASQRIPTLVMPKAKKHREAVADAACIALFGLGTIVAGDSLDTT